MAAVTTPLFAQLQPGLATTGPDAPAKGAPEQFQDALTQALNVQSKAGAPATAAVSEADPAAQARARAALGLQGPADASGGDAVLNGLQKLRGVFDQEIGAMASSTKNVTSSEGFFHVQMVAAEFSLFMDVGSKLAGKAGQALESLLKGQ
jgi:hypothetical protein